MVKEAKLLNIPTQAFVKASSRVRAQNVRAIAMDYIDDQGNWRIEHEGFASLLEVKGLLDSALKTIEKPTIG